MLERRRVARRPSVVTIGGEYSASSELGLDSPAARAHMVKISDNSSTGKLLIGDEGDPWLVRRAYILLVCDWM